MDDHKTTKQYLMRVRRLEKRIAQLEEITRQAWEAETAITAAPNADRVQTAGERRKGESYAALSDQCAREIVRLNHVKADTLRTIGKVSDNTLAGLLTAYYVMGKTWEQTAVAIHYSYYRTVHDKHPQALKAVEEILKEENEDAK